MTDETVAALVAQVRYAEVVAKIMGVSVAKVFEIHMRMVQREVNEKERSEEKLTVPSTWKGVQ